MVTYIIKIKSCLSECEEYVQRELGLMIKFLLISKIWTLLKAQRVGQKKQIRYIDAKIFSGVLMKCENGGWAIQGFKIMLMRKSKGQRTSGWSVLKFKKYAKENI